MASGSGTYHRLSDDGGPLCGPDQLGYVWPEPHRVTCRACQLIMEHPDIEDTAKKLALITKGPRNDSE